MIYSCAYWRDARDLAGAQEAKLDLVARKLRLEPGMRVLDIGCGWGGAAAFMAERHGVRVVGVTVSRNQAQTARARTAHLPVEIRFEDYRALTGSFDRIYSLGMFEHVGPRNYAAYFRAVGGLLRPGGLFLLHTIGNRYSRRSNDPWIEKYIFPNSQVPSRAQLALALEGRFVVEDWHEFGRDYDRTLLEWRANFERSWPEIAPRYGERFRRMWTYWLCASAASFRARDLELWQVLLSPTGVVGGLPEVR
jgi:cyclopropane-fatty-acyl-phospholipid synthase